LDSGIGSFRGILRGAGANADTDGGYDGVLESAEVHRSASVLELDERRIHVEVRAVSTESEEPADAHRVVASDQPLSRNHACYIEGLFSHRQQG
jgi:hypothetical protein